MYPLIIMGGAAGSGKDTVAAMLADASGAGTLIAQADPMKRFVRDWLGFTEEQLWGPSEMRNGADPRFGPELGPDTWSGLDVDNIQTLVAMERLVVEVGYLHKFDDLQEWVRETQKRYLKLPVTPRAILQLFGTEFGRTSLHPDVWSDRAIRSARQVLAGKARYDRTQGIIEDGKEAGASLVVITDGRFRNEILNVKGQAGRAVQVYNPAPTQDAAAVEAAGIKGHSSEAELRGIPRSWYDYKLHNDKQLGLDHLRSVVDSLATSWSLKP